MTIKLPAMQFYPGDWRKDVGVQTLSYHDRGVWFEMLCLMHESERRGVLVLNHKAMSDEMLARLLGLDIQILTTTLTNLIATGVASREVETGAIFNRRMVRDERLRQVRTEVGKLGGNPNLVKQNPTTRVKQNSTPSSSVSSSSSSSKDVSGATHPHPAAARRGNASGGACEAIYDRYPRKEGRRAALTAIDKAIVRLRKGEAGQNMAAEEAAAFLLERTSAYAESPVGRQPDRTKIPHPTTWFNQGRYGDDPANWRQISVDGDGTRDPEAVIAAQRIALAQHDAVHGSCPATTYMDFQNTVNRTTGANARVAANRQAMRLSDEEFQSLKPADTGGGGGPLGLRP